MIQIEAEIKLRSTWVDTCDLYMEMYQIRSCKSIRNKQGAMGKVSIGLEWK